MLICVADPAFRPTTSPAGRSEARSGTCAGPFRRLRDGEIASSGLAAFVDASRNKSLITRDGDRIAIRPVVHVASVYQPFVRAAGAMPARPDRQDPSS